MIDRTTFFGEVRRTLFAGRLAQSQVDGVNAILDEWAFQQLSDVRHLAYMLATSYHEVGMAMQPVKEYGGEEYFFRLYDIGGGRPAVARQLGNLRPGDGARFPGRGLVQLRGRRNYARMSALVSRPRFDIDLEKDPDAALHLDIAVAVMFEGMLDACSEFGDFTGLALDDFFSATKNDPVGARRIVNGLDQAELIADHHRKFLAAISAAAHAVAA